MVYAYEAHMPVGTHHVDQDAMQKRGDIGWFVALRLAVRWERLPMERV